MGDLMITKLKCQRCGHQWVPRQENIQLCPACKSRKWNEKKEAA